MQTQAFIVSPNYQGFHEISLKQAGIYKLHKLGLVNAVIKMESKWDKIAIFVVRDSRYSEYHAKSTELCLANHKENMGLCFSISYGLNVCAWYFQK